MNKFLMMAALAFVMMTPAHAEDAAVIDHAAVDAAEAAATEEKPMMEQAMDAVVDTAESVVDAVEEMVVPESSQKCTDETNEKVKLPENADEAEKEQWQAAFDECVVSHNKEEMTEADADGEAHEAHEEGTEE